MPGPETDPLVAGDAGDCSACAGACAAPDEPCPADPDPLPAPALAPFVTAAWPTLDDSVAD